MSNAREFLLGARSAALAGALLLGLLSAASAQNPSVEELMQPGPLPELVLGKADAPVTVIEYASMTCPHCANFHARTYPKLKEKYIDTGKVRYIFREFPLDPLAAAGSMLARCAGQDKAMSLIEVLFEKQKEWAVRQPLAPLMAIARQAGFTQQSFEQCLANQKLLDDIDAGRRRAMEKFGVNSTPTFFINGKVQRGDLSLDEIEKALPQ